MIFTGSLQSVRHISSSRPVFSKITLSAYEMSRAMSVTFLGTSSGGGPSLSRNCSSLLVDLGLKNGSLWMVDCGEGTLRQFHLQPWAPDRSNPRVTQVKKIFVTHMHADHVLGIIPILRNVLFPPPVGQDAPQLAALRKPYPAIEIYGPAGIRTFVRSILKMTFTKMADKYTVHELLTNEDEPTSCEEEVMHVNEAAGKDIICSPEDGFWRDITQDTGAFGPISVDVGPISHRDPCLGYVFRETVEPSRKIVVLGDTHDSSTIIPLCINPPPSLLIHEATDAYIPQEIDPKAKRSVETVNEKALARGHSTPQKAGVFARAIGAQKLVLNHIGSRFPAPHSNERRVLQDLRANVIAEIEQQASTAWGMGSARAAWDFMRVVVPAPDSEVSSQQDGQLGQPHTPHTYPSRIASYPTASNTWANPNSQRSDIAGGYRQQQSQVFQARWKAESSGSQSEKVPRKRRK